MDAGVYVYVCMCVCVHVGVYCVYVCRASNYSLLLPSTPYYVCVCVRVYVCVSVSDDPTLTTRSPPFS